MKIESGDTVIILLHTPREKMIGTVDEIGPAGISVRGIDLEYFDDWIAAIAADEPHLSMSDNFFPMWRVERLTRDEATGGSASLAEHFEARTGMKLKEM
jgi:hypothetical protein